MGTPLLKHEFETAGFVLTEEDPDIVLLGFDTTLNYEKLKRHASIFEMDAFILE